MTNRQTRALCYAALFVLVAWEWTFVGGALFLATMDYVTGERIQPGSDFD